jgi:hypothetical protein
MNTASNHLFKFKNETAGDGSRRLIITRTSLGPRSGPLQQLVVEKSRMKEFLAGVYAAMERMGMSVQNAVIEEIRQRHPKAYTPWSIEEKRLLIHFWNRGYSIGQLARSLGRTEGATKSRLKKLNRHQESGASIKFGFQSAVL